MNFGDPGWPLGVGQIGYTGSARIIQIVNSSTLLISVADKTVLFRGLGTHSLVDGDTLYPYLAEVIGRTSYKTVLGANATVYVLEKFNIEPFRQTVPPSVLKE